MARYLAWLALVCPLAAACGDTYTPLSRPPEPPAGLFADVIPGTLYTRGAGGRVVPGAVYANPADVVVFAAGVTDGDYLLEIVDDACTRELGAAPEPRRAARAERGRFGPVPLAPFMGLPAGATYRVYAAPPSFVTDRGAYCFGFPALGSLTTTFSLASTESTLRR
jgi:hypothetical protein